MTNGVLHRWVICYGHGQAFRVLIFIFLVHGVYFYHFLLSNGMRYPQLTRMDSHSSYTDVVAAIAGFSHYLVVIDQNIRTNY